MKRAAVGGVISIPTLLIIGFAIVKMLGGGGNGATQQQQDFIQNGNSSISGIDFSSDSESVDGSVAVGLYAYYQKSFGRGGGCRSIQCQNI